MALLLVALALSDGRPVGADEHLLANLDDLADLSLEQLAEIEVMSVSRRLEPLSEAAASIYVITPEDIRRSGAVTLPDALRLAPNLQVARADASRWAISARGYNSIIANNMLVLIDGRTVYSPLFSGVFWEAQDLPLEDIERIEVISGPGGTLWGTNAVNGVINILTRTAGDTQGALIAAGMGSDTKVLQARFGDALGSKVSWRFHGRFVELAETENAAGAGSNDLAQRWQGGFRADQGDSVSGVTLIGGAYRTEITQLPSDRIVENKHLLVAWSRRLGVGRKLRLQAYYDRNDREQPGSIRDALDTYDIEFQHPLAVQGRHRLLWGAGFRRYVDRLENLGPGFAFVPADRTLDYLHAFAEDDIRLGDDADLVLGLKLERNDYTHWEALPTVRLAYRPGTARLVWAAFSRAVRAPSRIDRELFTPAAGPPFTLAGGPDFRSEVAHAAELGYRAQPTPFLSWSLTGFVHSSDRLRSFEPSPDGPVFGNGLEGTTTGLEAWSKWRLLPWWRVDLGYVEQRRTVRRDPDSGDFTDGSQLGNDPHRWASLHSAVELFGGHEFDVWVRHVAALPRPAVPAYVAFDARLGLRLPHGLELSVTGRNLFDDRHPEWGVAPLRPEFERGILAQLRWRFWRT
ncbi:MAG: TonB-dependent receptor [Candidatus Eisenbacteria bacterium]